MPLTRSQIARIKAQQRITDEQKRVETPDPPDPTPSADSEAVKDDEMTLAEQKAFGQAIMMHTVRIICDNDLGSAHRIVNFLEHMEIETTQDLILTSSQSDAALDEAKDPFTGVMTLTQFEGLLKRFDASDFPDSLQSIPPVSTTAKDDSADTTGSPSDDTVSIKLSMKDKLRLRALFKWVMSNANELELHMLNLNETTYLQSLTGNTTSSTSLLKNGVTFAPNTKPGKTFGDTIKKDPTHYPKFQDDAKYVEWSSEFLSLCYMHDVYDIIDPKNKPNEKDPEYAVKSNFLFNVFSRTFLSPRTKQFVIKHAQARDARSIYLDVLKEFNNGNPHTEIDVQKLRTSFETVLLDNSWKRTRESFFTRFEKTLTQLETIEGKQVDETQKVTWLRKAVQPCTELWNQYTTAITTQSVTTGKPITDLPYQSMLQLFKHLSVTHDESNKKRRTQQTNSGERSGRGRGRGRGRSGRGGRGGRGGQQDPDLPKFPQRIPPEDWVKMSQEEKEAHKAKMKAARAARTAYRASLNPSPASAPAPAPPPATPITIQTHEAQQQPSGSATTTTPPPGTLVRQMLSTQHADQQQGQQSQQQQSQQQSASQEEAHLTFNGIRYRRCNASHRVYSTHNASSHGPSDLALVDGGNNGGIAGENCLIIDETFQTVDVKGVGDGFIENIPIGTVAGLITTTGAPIVGYFPQYALYGKGKTLHSSNQLRAFGNTVDDCPTNCGGLVYAVLLGSDSVDGVRSSNF